MLIETISDVVNIGLSLAILYFGFRIASCLRLSLQRSSLRLLIGAAALFGLKEILGFTEKQFFVHDLLHLCHELLETGFISCLCASMYLVVRSNRSEIAPLHDLTEIDRLTGLYNLSAFREHAARSLIYAGERALPLAILMFDIDDFKLYNDSYGHEAGNEALQAVSKILQNSARENDLFGRYGGEEFIALLFTSREAVMGVAERIRAAVEASCSPEQNGSLQRRITLSVGGAELSPQTGLDEAIEAADKELYRAKRAGKNCVAVQGG